MTDQDPTTETRGDRKRRAKQAAQDSVRLVEEVAALQDDALANIPLDPVFRHLIHEIRAMRPDGARRRLTRYVGKRFHGEAMEPIAVALAALRARKQVTDKVEGAAIRWRDRLMMEGDSAVDALLAVHPEVDRQQLRHLARQAHKEQAASKSSRAGRALMRLIRPLMVSQQTG